MQRVRARATIGVLHLLQPLARMWGRLGSGLTPWRRPHRAGVSLPAKTISFWSESWWPAEQWILDVEESLRSKVVDVRRAGSFDRFDLEARTGVMGATRVLFAVEDHAGGRQLILTRIWPHVSVFWSVAFAALVGLAMAAAVSGGPGVAILLGTTALVTGGRTVWEGIALTKTVGNVVSESLSPA
jgi:hypothetical protein